MTAAETPRKTAEERPEPFVPDRSLTLLAVAQLVLLTAGWGGNAPALRYSLNYLPPFGSAALRFVLGVAVVFLIARVQGVPLGLRRDQGRALAWLALLFGVQIALLNHGSALTHASRQALLINSYPLFVPVFAHFFLRGDRLSWNKAVGALLAFLGILLIFGEKMGSGTGSLVGDGLVLASGVLLAARTVYTSALVRESHPYQVLFWQMLLSLPAFALLSMLTERQEYRWSVPVVLSVLYQGVVVAGLCFVGWTALLRRYSPSRLSVGFFLTPVFGALLSYLLLAEPLTGGLLAGGAVILAGLMLANRKKPPA